MGHEPIIKALEEGAQLIIAGRSYDPSVFAAYPIMKGFDAGLAYHLEKYWNAAHYVLNLVRLRIV